MSDLHTIIDDADDWVSTLAHPYRWALIDGFLAGYRHALEDVAGDLADNPDGLAKAHALMDDLARVSVPWKNTKMAVLDEET